MEASGDVVRQADTGTSRWFSVFLGIVAVVAGIFAISAPFISGLVFSDVIGVILIIGALVHLISSIARHVSAWSVVLGVIVSILYALVGMFLLTYPLRGLFTVTVVLGALFVLVGLYRIATSLEASGIPGWGWAFTGGILTLILGIWILAALPASMIWALGIVVGVDLIFFGLALLFGYTVGGAVTAAGMRPIITT